MDDSFFRPLDENEQVKFRQWARNHWDPHQDPEIYWHPVVREEWDKISKESARLGYPLIRML